MAKSLLNQFKGLDQNIKDTVADLDSPLKIALSVLQLSNDKFGVEYLTAPAIIACLEAADISIKDIRIIRALAGARNKISRKIIAGEPSYKIMIHGRRYIDDIFSKSNLEISYVESGRPRTARKLIDQFLSSFSGTIKICDPYYGARSFDVLEMIPASCKVLFLTCQTSEGGRKLNGIIRDFKKEFPNTYIKLGPSKNIHDRYILTNSHLMIVGHGFKDIGNKDSFIIKIDKKLCPDMWKRVKDGFDEFWQKSNPLI